MKAYRMVFKLPVHARIIHLRFLDIYTMRMNFVGKIRVVLLRYLFSPIWRDGVFCSLSVFSFVFRGFEMFFYWFIITDVMIQVENEIVWDVVIVHVITCCPIP